LRVINVGSKEEDSKCLSKTLDRNGQNTKVSKGGGVCRVPFTVLDVSIGFLQVLPPETSCKDTKLRFQRQAFSHAPIPALQLPLSRS